MDVGSHPPTNLNILLDRFIVIQGCAQLMSPKGNVSEGVWRRLRGLSVQENCGAGRLTLQRQGGDFLSRFELQMDLRSHPPANLNILLDRFIVIQSCAQLMSPKGKMGNGVCGPLFWLSGDDEYRPSRPTSHP